MVERITSLPLNLDFYPEGSTVDVWAHLDEGPPVVFRDVSEVMLYQGWWLVEYRLFPSAAERVSGYILENRVRYFTLVSHPAEDA